MQSIDRIENRTNMKQPILSYIIIFISQYSNKRQPLFSLGVNYINTSSNLNTIHQLVSCVSIQNVSDHIRLR